MLKCDEEEIELEIVENENFNSITSTVWAIHLRLSLQSNASIAKFN